MAGGSTHPDAKRNFVLQQGLHVAEHENCGLRFSSLMFQPRVVGTVLLAAVILQSPAIFLVLSGVLWWSALLPRRNPFDAIYNRTFGARQGALRLDPAPAPRRFAQGMAGSFCLAIGTLLLFGAGTASLVLQVLLLAAVAALNFGRFCLGSFLYHLLRGDPDYAMDTLPWKSGAGLPRPGGC
ncbi:MAG: hypothetical protein H6Q84_896 [Deltaproteobacteria bacterium]|nr:hypothetical protein [Deltaproteobacteria bacterium]